MRRSTPESVAREYLSGLWESGWNIERLRSRRWSAFDLDAMRAVVRASFTAWAAERLDARDAETLRDRESALDIGAVARLRGTSVATIARRRRCLEPKLEQLWLEFYRAWSRDPVPARPFTRARRHPREPDA
jgi:hypothetical protein